MHLAGGTPESLSGVRTGNDYIIVIGGINLWMSLCRSRRRFTFGCMFLNFALAHRPPSGSSSRRFARLEICFEQTLIYSRWNSIKKRKNNHFGDR
jgi:hypothetical protein